MVPRFHLWQIGLVKPLLILIFLLLTHGAAHALRCSAISPKALIEMRVAQSELQGAIEGYLKVLHGYKALPPNIYQAQKDYFETVPPPPFGHYSKIYDLEEKSDPGNALALAKLYLQDYRGQDAVWTLEKAGQVDLARWLIDALQKETIVNLYTTHGLRLGGYPDSSRFVRIAKEYRWFEIESEAHRLHAQPESRHRSRDLYRQLAEDYLSQNMLQEAIWSFRKAGLKIESQNVQNHLNELLMTTNLEGDRHRQRGITRSFSYEIAPGVRVIAKPKSGFMKGNQKPEPEMIAYKLSEFLGLNTISTTVLRTIRGQEVSLQVLVQTPDFLPPMSAGQREGWGNMNLFDYLIANQDRSNDMGAHNLVFRFGQNPVWIDHGMSFRPNTYIKKIFPRMDQIPNIFEGYQSLSNHKPDIEFLRTLNSLDNPTLHRKLAEVFSGQQYDANYRIFEERRKRILEEVRRLGIPLDSPFTDTQ